jgi:hypothetical protein
MQHHGIEDEEQEERSKKRNEPFLASLAETQVEGAHAQYLKSLKSTLKSNEEDASITSVAIISVEST